LTHNSERHLHYATSDIRELFRELGTTENGLSNEEARRRLELHGPNLFFEPKAPSITEKLLRHSKNLFNILLAFASVTSFVTGFLSLDTSFIQLGAGIAAAMVANIIFAVLQERRAEKAAEAVRRLIPANATVIREGETMQIPVSQVVVGDIILLDEGATVAADGRLISAFETQVNNGALTGESDPRRRFATIDPNMKVHNITDYPNLVFAGTTVASGSAKALVIATGRDTLFGRIASASREVKEPASTLEIEAANLARIDSMAAVIVGFVFFLFGILLVNLTLLESLFFMIGVIISLVPEGFQVTISLALALMSQGMSKKKVLVKRLSSIATIGSTTVVCVDKTGTITRGEMTIKKVWSGGITFDVAGDGYEPKGITTIGGRQVSDRERFYLLKLREAAAFCNNASLIPPSDRIPTWTSIGDPTDAAFHVFAVKGDFNIRQSFAENPRVYLLPFDSNRKMMTSIHKNAKTGVVTAYTKGAPELILGRSDSILYDHKVIPLTDDIRAAVRERINQFASEGYRVLALASKNLIEKAESYTPDEAEYGLTFLGLAALLDPPRPDAEMAVRRTRAAGVRVIMLTGDYSLTAESVAKKAGIITAPDAMIISGHELSRLSDEELSKMLLRQEVVVAGVTAEQKLRIVKLLKGMGEIVTVTGDGVNDAPALKQADVGIAMGLTGTDVTKESADMILLDESYASIVKSIESGRTVFDNLKKFLIYIFTHNFAELSAFLAFILLPIPLPLSIPQILAIDLLLEIPPSIALILEPPEPGVMERPPRGRGSRLFTFSNLLRPLYIGVLIFIPALLGSFNTWVEAGWRFGERTVPDAQRYAKGTTMFMASIIAAQLGNLFSTRSDVVSALRLSPLGNKWLVIGILTQVVMLLGIVYVPFLQAIFGTAPLSLPDWGYLYSIALFVLAVDEVRKYILRRIRRGSKGAAQSLHQ